MNEPARDDDLLIFLVSRDAAFCIRCLTMAFPQIRVASRLEELRAAGAALMTGDGRCAICAQYTTVVAYVPDNPELARMVRKIP